MSFNEPVTNRPRVLDTFAGAGGFSLGLERAGCQVVGAIERDAWACDTFEYNHPAATVIRSDIENVSERMLESAYGRGVDIVVGGPPCQGFSLCLPNSGDPSDPRNTLFQEFVRLVRVLQPRIAIMENVPALVRARTHERQLVIDIIVSELEKLSYDVDWRVLEATDYGVPQIRKRLFVVATKGPFGNVFPAPTHFISAEGGQKSLLSGSLLCCPTLYDAISDLPDVDAGGGARVQDYAAPAANAYQELMRCGSTHVYNHVAMKHTRRLVERFSHMAWGESVSDAPEHLRPLARNGNGLTSAKAFDQNNRRMHPNKPCHTVPAAFYANFVHPYKHRNFTPREGARIQSFPDCFVFRGKPTVVSHKLLEREGRIAEKHLCQYNQIGNAVPPLLAQALATSVLAGAQEHAGTRS